MTQKSYLATLFVMVMMLPLLSAKTSESSPKEEFDLSTVHFIETEEQIELEFDTTNYLPEDFDSYRTDVENIHSIDFIEDETIELGFGHKAYLPKGFNPYK